MITLSYLFFMQACRKDTKGRYWTERNTIGEIILTHYDSNPLEDIPEGLNQHPVTEEENIR